MSETVTIILMILIMIGVLIITLHIAGWKMKRAGDFILRDLKEKKAFDPASAVELPYCKTSLFHIGMRDYRPKALNALVKIGDVRVLEGGRYYLREGHEPTGTEAERRHSERRSETVQHRPDAASRNRGRFVSPRFSR